MLFLGLVRRTATALLCDDGDVFLRARGRSNLWTLHFRSRHEGPPRACPRAVDTFEVRRATDVGKLTILAVRVAQPREGRQATLIDGGEASDPRMAQPLQPRAAPQLGVGAAARRRGVHGHRGGRTTCRRATEHCRRSRAAAGRLRARPATRSSSSSASRARCRRRRRRTRRGPRSSSLKLSGGVVKLFEGAAVGQQTQAAAARRCLQEEVALQDRGLRRARGGHRRRVEEVRRAALEHPPRQGVGADVRRADRPPDSTRPALEGSSVVRANACTSALASPTSAPESR